MPHTLQHTEPPPRRMRVLGCQATSRMLSFHQTTLRQLGRPATAGHGHGQGQGHGHGHGNRIYREALGWQREPQSRDPDLPAKPRGSTTDAEQPQRLDAALARCVWRPVSAGPLGRSPGPAMVQPRQPEAVALGQLVIRAKPEKLGLPVRTGTPGPSLLPHAY